jgi:hypothetical protein
MRREIRGHGLWGLAVVILVALAATVQGQSTPVKVTPDQAKDHAGEYATVEGRVFGVHTTSSKTTFLNFGAPFPRNTFLAVVFSSDAGKFQDLARPDGATVQVTGVIKLYQGKPEIVLKSPSQLRVVSSAN